MTRLIESDQLNDSRLIAAQVEESQLNDEFIDRISLKHVLMLNTTAFSALLIGAHT